MNFMPRNRSEYSLLVKIISEIIFYAKNFGK